MGKSNRYSKKLKPSKQSIEVTYSDFRELNLLIGSETVENAGFFILNNGKWFSRSDYPNFLNFRIKHDSENIYLEKIETHLSPQNKLLRVKRKNIDKNWKNHKNKPQNTYGSKFVSTYKDIFNRGHLIADSLLEFSDSFELYKWQDFVMLTDWCNRANSNNEASGMYYFEEIILNSLKSGVELDYRVTPVFKKVEGTNKFEVLPRGIILEAKITNNKEFVTSHKNKLFPSNELNVFIPNAQENYVINYETGEISMNDLFIIGNGFDLAHELQTKYIDFLYFIYNKYVDRIDKSDFKYNFEEITENLSVNMGEVEYDYDNSGVPIKINFSYAVQWFMKLFTYTSECNYDYWNKLEEALGTIDFELILEDSVYRSENSKCSFEEDDYLDSISYEWPKVAKLLNIWLREWILNIDENKISSERFSEAFYYLSKDRRNLFLNFNYTLTLEEVYKVSDDRVLHIHGKKHDRKYIFGCKKNQSNEMLLESPSASDNIIATENIFPKVIQINKIKKFLESASDIKTIKIIGFSFGEVDHPYIQQICKLYPNAKWILNRHNNQEVQYKNTLNKIFKVPVNNIAFSDLI